MRPPRFHVGEMRQKIVVQRPRRISDDSGQEIVIWEEWLPLEPAKILFTGGLEAMYGQQLEAGTDARIIVRYRDGYNTRLRILYRGQEYGINHINELGGGLRYLELFVSKSDAALSKAEYTL